MRMLIVFEKGKLLRHIGHLDLLRTMQRALRRSGLPVAYSQGFNPHIIVAFASALSVGLSGQNEIMDLKLTVDVQPDFVLKRLQAALPPSLIIKKVKPIEDTHPSPMSMLKAARYNILFYRNDADDVVKAIPSLLAEEEVVVMRKTKKGMSACNIRPMIFSITHKANSIDLFLSASEKENCKPSLVIEALCQKAGRYTLPKSFVERIQLYGKNKNNTFVALETL